MIVRARTVYVRALAGSRKLCCKLVCVCPGACFLCVYAFVCVCRRAVHVHGHVCARAHALEHTCDHSSGCARTFAGGVVWVCACVRTCAHVCVFVRVSIPASP